MHRLIATSAIASLALHTTAMAAEAPCLTAREASAVAAYAMPSAIEGTARRCAPVLKPDAFLNREGSALVERYSAHKRVVWPEAKAALIKMTAGSGGQMLDTLKALPDETLQQMLDALVSGAMAEKVPTSSCGTVDRVISLIAPLPPESAAELIALSLGIMSHGDNPRIGKMAICKA